MNLDEIGVHYLTAASIQQWADAPAVWIMQRLYGLSKVGGPALARSIALKEGLSVTLMGQDRGQGEDVALRVYARKLLEYGIDAASEAALSEEDSILPMLDCLVKEIQRRVLLRRPNAWNISNTVWVDGLDVPLLSVADFVFDTLQLRVKFTLRCPSSVSPSDLAALTINASARSLPAHVVYVTPKKLRWLEPTRDELTDAMQDLIEEAQGLQTFLLTATSREHALAMVPLRRQDFRWSPVLFQSAIEKINQARNQIDGLIRAKGRGISDGSGRDAHSDLLPGAGFGDSEVEL